MTKKKRLILLSSVGLVGIFLAVHIRGCIVSTMNPQPWILGAVTVPDKKITVTLWAGSRQIRHLAALIQPFEGVNRIMQVAQHDQPTMYFDLVATLPGEGCEMEVYWYPTNNYLRFMDKGFKGSPELRSECLLDLNKKLMFAVVRHNSDTYVAKLSASRSDLLMPQSRYDERAPHTFGGGFSQDGQSVTSTVTIGDEDAVLTHDSWAKESGTFVGLISPRH